jgi:hypothetical protein
MPLIFTCILDIQGANRNIAVAITANDAISLLGSKKFCNEIIDNNIKSNTITNGSIIYGGIVL